MVKLFYVEPGKKVDLNEWKTDSTPDFDGKKADAAPEIEKLNTKLEELQELLYAEGKTQAADHSAGYGCSRKGRCDSACL